MKFKYLLEYVLIVLCVCVLVVQVTSCTQFDKVTRDACDIANEVCTYAGALCNSLSDSTSTFQERQLQVDSLKILINQFESLHYNK